MKTKRILAASTAALLAFGTVVANVASATEGVDTWTIDGNGAGDEAITSADINVYSKSALTGASFAANWATVKNGDKNDGNNYNKELSVAIWEAYKKYNFTDFKGGNVTIDLEGTAVKWTEARVEITLPNGTDKDLVKISAVNGYKKVLVPELKDNKAIVITANADAADAGDINSEANQAKSLKVTVVDLSKYDGKAGGGKELADATVGTELSVGATTGIHENGDDLVFGNTATATDKVATQTVKGSAKTEIKSGLRDSAGSATTAPDGVKYGKQSGTVQINPVIDGLSELVRLQTVDLSKSKMTIDISGTVDGATFNNYYMSLDSNGKRTIKNYTISEDKDYTWDWTTTSNGQFGGSPDNAVGLQVLAGYPNATGYAAALPNSFKAEPTLTKEKENYTIPRLISWTPTAGSNTSLSFGNLVPPAVLKALNEGGTITFEFNRELTGNEYFFGTMMFGYNNGTYANNISIEPTYGNGKTATVTIPAGLTYYADEKNPWQNVGIGWVFNFEKLGSDIFTQGDPDNNDTDKRIKSLAEDPEKGVDIVKMTFAAKGAVIGDGTSGSTSGSTGTSGSGNSNASPNTGIALAIAPVVLAAGAVAVVALKKKH